MRAEANVEKKSERCRRDICDACRRADWRPLPRTRLSADWMIDPRFAQANVRAQAARNSCLNHRVEHHADVNGGMPAGHVDGLR